MNKPFFREAKDSWYCWLQGSMKSLGVKGKENEAEAYKRWQKFLSDEEPEAKKEVKSVRELVEDYWLIPKSE